MDLGFTQPPFRLTTTGLETAISCSRRQAVSDQDRPLRSQEGRPAERVAVRPAITLAGSSRRRGDQPLRSLTWTRVAFWVSLQLSPNCTKPDRLEGSARPGRIEPSALTSRALLPDAQGRSAIMGYPPPRKKRPSHETGQEVGYGAALARSPLSSRLAFSFMTVSQSELPGVFAHGRNTMHSMPSSRNRLATSPNGGPSQIIDLAG